MLVYPFSTALLYLGTPRDYTGKIPPAGTTAVPPPDNLDGHARRFDPATQTWSQVPLADLVPPDTRNLDQRKADARTLVTDYRWQSEMGGVDWTDAEGATIRLGTDVDSRTRLQTALDACPAEGSSQYKLGGEFRAMSKAGLTALRDAVSAHVQACFDRERELWALIDACESIEALQALDVNEGWPGSDHSRSQLA